MLSLRKYTETGSILPRYLSEMSGFAVGVVFVGVVLTFQPYGLDQFLLPKALFLLGGAPLVLGLVVAGRGLMDGDTFLIGLVVSFLVWSTTVPLLHAHHRVLHGVGALELVALVVLFFGAIAVRTAGLQAQRHLIRLLALPALIVASLAVAQGLGVDPLRLVFDLSSTRPGRWQVLTTLGNPTWTAEMLVLSLPLVLAAWRPVGRSRVVWLWAVGWVFAAAVAATGSRGALVGLAVVAVVGWRLGLAPVVRRPRWAVLWALIVAGVIVMVMGVGRMGELKPLTGRLGLWAAGIHLVGQEPLTGSGLRHTVLILPEGLESVVAGLDSQHHGWLPTILVDRLDQDLLQVAVERGLPAALLILLIWYRALMMSLNRFRKGGASLDGAIVVLLATFAVLSLFSAPFHTPATAVLFWIVVGLAVRGPAECSVLGVERHVHWRLGAAVVGAVLTIGLAVEVALPIIRTNAIAGTGYQLLVEGRFHEASRVLSPVPAGSPWLTAASIARSRALVAMGRAPEALVVIEDAEEWASSEWFWATRTRALHQMGFKDEAWRELEFGLRVLPRSPVLLEAQSELGLQ